MSGHVSYLKIIPFGDAQAVKAAVKNLGQSNVAVIGVRDGDQPEVAGDKLFKLPGSQAPEKEVFLSESAKQMLLDDYAFDLDHYMITHPETDHHEYSSVASQATGTSREVIETDAIRAYMNVQVDDWASDLLNKIEQSD